jgi:predicted O-methyltransferase YrrM
MMNESTWAAVDQSFCDTLAATDDLLDATLRDSAAARLPPISVSANQGKLLYLLAQMQRAENILEIGTLGGYSTIWLARALPAGGQLITLEASARHAAVARANLARAGFAEVADVREGAALASLPKIAAEGRPAFDMSFIDADKSNNPEYFAWALKLSKPGSIIVVDNVVRDGAVIDASRQDASVRGVRRLAALIAATPNVSATAIQTVGAKGYDGFILARVTAA